MPIQFNCPFCNQNLEAEDDMQGSTLECLSCNNHIQVPLLVKSKLKIVKKKSPFIKVLLAVLLLIMAIIFLLFIYERKGELSDEEKKAIKINELSIYDDTFFIDLYNGSNWTIESGVVNFILYNNTQEGTIWSRDFKFSQKITPLKSAMIEIKTGTHPQAKYSTCRFKKLQGQKEK